MIRKTLFFLLALFVLINAVGAVDSSNWTTATVGYEEFSIPTGLQSDTSTLR